MARSIWTSAVAAAGACLILTTAACGVTGEVTTAPPAQASAIPPATSAVDSTAPTDPAPPDNSTPAASAPTEPDPERYRTFRGSFEGIPVRAEIYPIRRGSRTATANVRFVVAKGSRTFRILESLNDRNPELSDKGRTSPDGLRLIDAQASKAYLPATTGDHDCLCSPMTNGWTDHYTDVTVSVTFAAPPTERQTIDLLLPHFGTVNDVPLR